MPWASTQHSAFPGIISSLATIQEVPGNPIEFNCVPQDLPLCGIVRDLCLHRVSIPKLLDKAIYPIGPRDERYRIAGVQLGSLVIDYINTGKDRTG